MHIIVYIYMCMFVSACSGGHPAEWIVTDVSQLGEGDRLPTHIKLTMGRLSQMCYVSEYLYDSFWTNSNISFGTRAYVLQI